MQRQRTASLKRGHTGSPPSQPGALGFALVYSRDDGVVEPVSGLQRISAILECADRYPCANGNSGADAKAYRCVRRPAA
jgi:hypothetical protein